MTKAYSEAMANYALIKLDGGRSIIFPKLSIMKASSPSDWVEVVVQVNNKSSVLEFAIAMYNAVLQCFSERKSVFYIPVYDIRCYIHSYTVVELDMTDDVYKKMLSLFGKSLATSVIQKALSNIRKNETIDEFVDTYLWREFKQFRAILDIDYEKAKQLEQDELKKESDK